MLPICFPLVITSHSHTEGSADGGRRMPYAEGVVLAFTALGESTESIVFPVRWKHVAAAGKDFVSVSLMAYIPYQLVVRRVKHIVQGNAKFYNSKAGSKVAAMYAHHIDDVLA